MGLRREAFYILLAVALAGTAGATVLGTVDIKYSGRGASDPIKVWGGGKSAYQVYGGMYAVTKSDGTGQGNLFPNGVLGVFCIEIQQNASDGINTYNVKMPQFANEPDTFLGGVLGPVKEAYLRELWGRYYDSAWYPGQTYTTAMKKAAEAFAACVWEIVYEDVPATPAGWDVSVDGTAGDRGFYCADADFALANGWLHSLDGSGPKADLRAFTNCQKQDFIIEVPEPASIAIIGSGLVLFAVGKKK